MAGRRPVRRAALACLTAGVVLTVGGLVFGVLRFTGPQRRAAAGTPVQALVLHSGSWGSGHFGGPRITVAYHIGDADHQVNLGALVADRPARGTVITVYVDPADPDSAVTDTGFVSDYRMELLPPILMGLGIITIGTAGPRLRRPAREPVAVVVREGFGYAMPGYRADAVNRLLDAAERALLNGAADDRAAALAALRDTDLPTARRGYRRAAVDRYISQLCAELAR